MKRGFISAGAVKRLGRDGFTLLETMIAMGIMLVAFSSILMVESASLRTSEKARQMNVVAMLAKNLMVEAENTFEGKPFNEVKKEESGQFPAPYEDFRWKRTIKELEFPNMSFGGGDKKEGASSSSDSGQDQFTELLTKLMTSYFSKAIREVQVTISWQRGSGEQSFTTSTYWVDLNHEFSLSQ